MKTFTVLIIIAISGAPAFAGYGGKIAFTSMRDGNAEVYVINADGSALTRVTNNKAYDDQPALSPDGSLVAFVSDRDGNHELYLAAGDGKGSPRRLTDTKYSELDPSFSADGEWVMFTSTAKGDKDISRINLQTGEVEDVIAADGDQFMARSADGVLVYVADGGDEEIMVRRGGADVNVSKSPGIDTMPSFSPDGKVVYFTSQRGGDYDLFAVNADGSDLRELVALESLEGRASASPDGAYLAVASDMDGDLEIYIFSKDGEQLEQLTQNDADDYEPFWSK